MYHKWKETVSNKCSSGNPEFYEEYRKYRNILSNLIKKSKTDYYNAIFSSSQNDKKKTWKLINSLRGKGKQSLSSTFNIDNKHISCRKTIANKFNSYFSSLAKNLNKNIDLNKENVPSFQSYLPKLQQQSLFLSETSTDEITSIIKDLKNGKSSDIPITVVKRVKDIIAPHLCKLFNSCISTGTFPLCLKLGKITPIHKKGPKNDISNYRPVSTLPIFGKIFEKIVYDRLFSFVTERRILSDTQFGFRKKYSTSHAINYSVNLIKQFRLKGKNIIGIFIDLSKAFDTINHSTLLTKLERYGIRGIPYDLIKSYLSDRYQAVNIDGTLSEREAVQCGVPQGSVLGPLLFLIYINDLQNCFTSPNVKFVLYADDTNIFVACNTVEEGILLAN